jgi:hypothetical protein
MQLGLQTAPVLLLFQPTLGPHAIADSGPLRYDFTNGYVPISTFESAGIVSDCSLDLLNLPNRYIPGSFAIFMTAPIPQSSGQSTGFVASPSPQLYWEPSLSSVLLGHTYCP